MSVSVSFIAFRLTCGRPERQRCASDCRATIYLLRYTPIHFDRQTCERRSLFPASLRRRAMSRPESGHMRGGPELPRICQDPLDRLTFSFPRSPQPPIVLVHCSSATATMAVFKRYPTVYTCPISGSTDNIYRSPLIPYDAVDADAIRVR